MTYELPRRRGGKLRILDAPPILDIDVERLRAVCATLHRRRREISWRELQELAPSVGSGWSLNAPERRSERSYHFTGSI